MEKRYFIAVALTLAIGWGSYVVFGQFTTSNQEAEHLSQTVASPNVALTQVGSAAVAIPLSPQSIPATETSLSSSTETVSLKAAEDTYQIPFTEGANVLDAMRSLASISSFRFTGKEYPSLGFFVEEINGLKNENGFYWFLYMNGKESVTGASQATLKAGDAIEWRYKR